VALVPTTRRVKGDPAGSRTTTPLAISIPATTLAAEEEDLTAPRSPADHVSQRRQNWASIRGHCPLSIVPLGAIDDGGRSAPELKNQKTWLPLNKLRMTWYKAPLASRVRNQGGHHLGDTDVYKAGMAKLGEMTVDIPLRVAHGQQRHHSFARGAWDILLLGMSSKTATRPEVEISHLQRLLKDAGVAHRKLHDALDAHLIAVVANAGVGITPSLTP
jgi:hypothetical protein